MTGPASSVSRFACAAWMAAPTRYVSMLGWSGSCACSRMSWISAGTFSPGTPARTSFGDRYGFVFRIDSTWDRPDSTMSDASAVWVFASSSA